MNQCIRFALAFGLLLAAIAGFGQTPGAPTTVTGSVGSTGTFRIKPATGQLIQSAPDPFDSLVSSAASFDMDSPVEARAEFDPPVATVGGRVIYRIEVSALDESLTVPNPLPTPGGLVLHAGGRGQTYQPVGGMKLRPQTTVIYRTTVTNTGTFIIPAFELMAYGKPVKVPAATLSVVPVSETNEHEPPRLLLELPEGDCYVGQMLRLPLILPVPPNGRVLGLNQPHIKGEFIFSEQFPMGMRQETMQRNGKSFSAFVQEVMITPLREGPQELVGQAHSYVMRPNPIQTNVIQSATLLIDSEPVTLTVKPLPAAGVLPGFTGAVGNFQIEPPKLSANEVRAGEPLTLTLTIRGDGNIGRLVPPPAPPSRDWQAFAPEPDATPAAMIQQRGFVNFKYTLIPLSGQIKATPAIPFSYFDPAKKAYVDLTIPAVPIQVIATPADTLAQKQAAESAAPNPDLDDPANHEKEPVLSGLAATPGAMPGSLQPLQQRGWFLALQILPVIALGGLWAWDRRRRYLWQHPEVVLKRRARRGLRRQLRLARRAATARDAAGFVTGAANALREACAPHTAATPGALVCADVLQELPAAARQGSTGENIRRLFAAADALRFGGPVRDSSDLLALQPDLEQVLAELRARL